ncbi:phospholipase A2 inhibitor and Ly6/PLAUR domain-containing protein-like [Caretta caretta]|uniref:phospholipase A2 inhibitor and Ly6/PLAUR domain-containing protein-like n=1 Tax=Caretta caretta TaxID=8467 RepID=UPI003F4CADE1
MVSFLLCLLPALLATSAQTTPPATLTCKTCFGQTKECSFVPGICQDNKATGGCLSVAEDIKLDGTQDMSFFKQCLSSYKSDIKVPISFTVGNGQYVRINTAQCNDADNCNSGALEVPTGSTTENGLQCPTCFALNFTVCNSTITPCTGDETYCLDFTGFLKNGPSSSPFEAKGCATASAQDIKPGSTLISTPYTFSFYWGATVPAEKTTDGASPALGKFSFALYLPGLTGLLLVKLLS